MSLFRFTASLGSMSLLGSMTLPWSASSGDAAAASGWMRPSGGTGMPGIRGS